MFGMMGGAGVRTRGGAGIGEGGKKISGNQS